MFKMFCHNLLNISQTMAWFFLWKPIKHSDFHFCTMKRTYVQYLEHFTLCIKFVFIKMTILI